MARAPADILRRPSDGGGVGGVKKTVEKMEEEGARLEEKEAL